MYERKAWRLLLLGFEGRVLGMSCVFDIDLSEKADMPTVGDFDTEVAVVM